MLSTVVWSPLPWPLVGLLKFGAGLGENWTLHLGCKLFTSTLFHPDAPSCWASGRNLYIGVITDGSFSRQHLNIFPGKSPAVWWLGLSAFTARPGSIPGRGTKIPQATWPVKKKIKKKSFQAGVSMTIFYFSTYFLNSFPCIHTHINNHFNVFQVCSPVTLGTFTFFMKHHNDLHNFSFFHNWNCLTSTTPCSLCPSLW